MTLVPLDSLVRADWLRKYKERRAQEQERQQEPLYIQEDMDLYYTDPPKED
jgi:hypothetical protein